LTSPNLVEIGRLTRDVEQIATEVARIERANFRLIMDSVYQGVIEADGEGRIVEWNRAALRLFGWSREELIGQPLTRIMPERFHERHRAGWAKWRATGEGPILRRPIRLEGLHKLGHEIPIELTVWPLDFDPLRCVAAFVRDLSELARLERVEAILRAQGLLNAS
jgi:PAS domain S-box-containing protein